MIQLNNQEERIINDSYFNFQKIKNSTLENKIEIINILKSKNILSSYCKNKKIE